MNNLNKEISKIKKLCPKLNRTYDTRIIDTLSLDTKKIIYDICKNNIYTKTGNKSLIKLIFNHFYFKNSLYNLNVKYIQGPISATRHKGIINRLNLNMEIVIFGEYHQNFHDCNLIYENIPNKDISEEKGKEISIQDFLYNFSQETDVFLDIYVEIPMLKKGIYEMKNIKEYNDLDRIFNKFTTCIEVPTRSKDYKCDLFRMHYIDVRREQMVNKHKIEDITYYFDMYYYEKKVLTGKWYNLLYKEFKEIYSMDLSKFKKFVTDDIFKNAVLKELDKSYMKTKIKNFIMDKLNKKIDNFFIMKSIIYNIFFDKDYDIDKKLSDFRLLQYYIITIGSFIVDIYTLSRIFKVFNVKDGVYQPNIPNNIIIYSGDSHSNTYREFLDSLGFERFDLYDKTTNISQGIKKCIKFDIKSFFSS